LPNQITLSSKLILLILLFNGGSLFAQSVPDPTLNEIDARKLSTSVENRLSKLEEKIISKTAKTLQRLQGQEEKIYQKQLSTKDSLEARSRLAEIRNRYQAIQREIKSPSSVTLPVREYIPHLDSINSVLKFLDQNSTTAGLKDALSKIKSFNDKVQRAQDVKDFIMERRQMLRQQLDRMGLLKQLRQFNKEVYYYSEQIREYKELISDPSKIEKKVIEMLSKTKAFQDFVWKNSMLASLFRIPYDPNDAGYLANLAGLQTRGQVNNLMQQQILSSGSNAQAQFRQCIQQAQSQMQQLKNKFIQLGRGSSDDIIPAGFKPNEQKMRSFLKRLEYGTNIQAQRATNFFPATTDIGLSVGYKLNDRSIIGLGASYKIGLGHGWDNMELSSQGMGLRSYLDWKLKGSVWISGGYELNYSSEFKSIDQLKNLTAWSCSGLLGLSKVFDVKNKFFNKTKLQLLWDFLSY
jgi:hypothetical protein